MFFLKLLSLILGLQNLCRACKCVWFRVEMWPVLVISNAVTVVFSWDSVGDICDEMGIFVSLVVMLFVDVCKKWACELENVELLVDSVQDCDVGLEVGDADLRGYGAPSSSLVSTVY